MAAEFEDSFSQELSDDEEPGRRSTLQPVQGKLVKTITIEDLLKSSRSNLADFKGIAEEDETDDLDGKEGSPSPPAPSRRIKIDMNVSQREILENPEKFDLGGEPLTADDPVGISNHNLIMKSIQHPNDPLKRGLMYWYPGWTCTRDLLNDMCDIFKTCGDSNKAKETILVRTRLIKFMMDWIDTLFFEDFVRNEDEQVILILSDFPDVMVACYKEDDKDIIPHTHINKLKKKIEHIRTNIEAVASGSPVIPPILTSPLSLDWLDTSVASGGSTPIASSAPTTPLQLGQSYSATVRGPPARKTVGKLQASNTAGNVLVKKKKKGLFKRMFGKEKPVNKKRAQTTATPPMLGPDGEFVDIDVLSDDESAMDETYYYASFLCDADLAKVSEARYKEEQIYNTPPTKKTRTNSIDRYMKKRRSKKDLSRTYTVKWRKDGQIESDVVDMSPEIKAVDEETPVDAETPTIFDPEFVRKKTKKALEIDDIEERFPELRIYTHMFPKNFKIFQLNAEDIAQQLTLMNSYLFKRVRPREFFKCAWKTKNKWQKSPNVTKMIENFNSEAKWVEIMLLTAPNPVKRAKLTAKCLQIAKLCYEYRNFSSVCAFHSALNHSRVQKLPIEWSKMKKSQRNAWTEFQDITGWGCRNIGKMQEHALSPAIPHIGLFLAKVFQIEETWKKYTNADGSINQNKLLYLVSRWDKVKQLQQSEYKFERKYDIQALLMDEYKGQMTLTEEQLHTLSKMASLSN